MHGILLSFIEIIVHPQICCFWCHWVDLEDLYNRSSLNFSRTIPHVPSISMPLGLRVSSMLSAHLLLQSGGQGTCYMERP